MEIDKTLLRIASRTQKEAADKKLHEIYWACVEIREQAQHKLNQTSGLTRVEREDIRRVEHLMARHCTVLSNALNIRKRSNGYHPKKLPGRAFCLPAG